MRLATIMAIILTPLVVTATAGSSTHSPCDYHGASTPYVSLANGNTLTLTGAGSIGGCPSVSSTTPETVTITVCLQHSTGAGWADVSCSSFSRAWNRYTRFARQAGGTVNAICAAGQWRTDVRGGDGLAPFEWWSATSAFVASDGYPCGEPGGGG